MNNSNLVLVVYDTLEDQLVPIKTSIVGLLVT